MRPSLGKPALRSPPPLTPSRLPNGVAVAPHALQQQIANRNSKVLRIDLDDVDSVSAETLRLLLPLLPPLHLSDTLPAPSTPSPSNPPPAVVSTTNSHS